MVVALAYVRLIVVGVVGQAQVDMKIFVVVAAVGVPSVVEVTGWNHLAYPSPVVDHVDVVVAGIDDVA